ncbi:MAG: hypothetical protein ACXQTS_03980, partial [Candidatus Methanospirareceae archaeon]
VAMEIAMAPSLGLSQEQLKELGEILDDFDRPIPPMEFEQILLSFKGVSKHAAMTASKRYAYRLDRMREELPLRVVKEMELWGEGRRYSEELRGMLGDFDREDIEERIANAVGREIRRSLESIKEKENDPVQKAVGKVFMNLADLSDIAVDLKRIFITALEEEVKENPELRKEILGKFQYFARLLRKSEERRREREEEERIERGEGREREMERGIERIEEEVRGLEEMPEFLRRRKGDALERLDEYFEEGERFEVPIEGEDEI